MTKEELQKENRRLTDKIECLTRRHDYAITQLVELSQGLGNKPHWYGSDSTWDTAMKYKAGLAVDKIAKMRLP